MDAGNVAEGVDKVETPLVQVNGTSPGDAATTETAGAAAEQAIEEGSANDESRKLKLDDSLQSPSLAEQGLLEDEQSRQADVEVQEAADNAVEEAIGK